MPTANDYLADATDQAAEALLTAFSLVPEDKLTWQAGPTNRSALDMVAECAILNGSTAAVVEAGQWVDVDFPAYVAEKEALVSRGKEATVALLKQNTARAVGALRAMNADNFATEMETQFGPMSMGRVAGYPFWNMTYHEGQINFIAMMLES